MKEFTKQKFMRYVLDDDEVQRLTNNYPGKKYSTEMTFSRSQRGDRILNEVFLKECANCGIKIPDDGKIVKTRGA